MTKVSSSPAEASTPIRGHGCQPAVGVRGTDLTAGPARMTQGCRAGSRGKGPARFRAAPKWRGVEKGGEQLTLPAAPPTRSLSAKPQSRRRRTAGNITPRTAVAAISTPDWEEDVLPGHDPRSQRRKRPPPCGHNRNDTLKRSWKEGRKLGLVLNKRPHIIAIREGVCRRSCIISYLDRLWRVKFRCGGVKGNLVQLIVPLVAGIDWTKWSTIQNSPSLRKRLLGETSVVR